MPPSSKHGHRSAFATRAFVNLSIIFVNAKLMMCADVNLTPLSVITLLVFLSPCHSVGMEHLMAEHSSSSDRPQVTTYKRPRVSVQ